MRRIRQSPGRNVTDHSNFYENVATEPNVVRRHEVFLDEYRRHRARLARPLDVLDVGCGEHAPLARGVPPEDRYFGIDMKSQVAAPLERFQSLDLDRDDLAAAWPGQKFDIVFCGEVIEHVFSPDRLLRQFASVMNEEAILLLSTPNLAYWVNRILLLFGITPLFVENSAERVLGRRWSRIGQGNVTQGHIRLFTHRAMLDLLRREGWMVHWTKGVPVWHLPGDKIACRSPYWAADNVYCARVASGAPLNPRALG